MRRKNNRGSLQQCVSFSSRFATNMGASPMTQYRVKTTQVNTPYLHLQNGAVNNNTDSKSPNIGRYIEQVVVYILAKCRCHY